MSKENATIDMSLWHGVDREAFLETLENSDVPEHKELLDRILSYETNPDPDVLHDITRRLAKLINIKVVKA